DGLPVVGELLLEELGVLRLAEGPERLDGGGQRFGDLRDVLEAERGDVELFALVGEQAERREDRLLQPRWSARGTDGATEAFGDLLPRLAARRREVARRRVLHRVGGLGRLAELGEPRDQRRDLVLGLLVLPGAQRAREGGGLGRSGVDVDRWRA